MNDDKMHLSPRCSPDFRNDNLEIIQVEKMSFSEIRRLLLTFAADDSNNSIEWKFEDIENPDPETEDFNYMFNKPEKEQLRNEYDQLVRQSQLFNLKVLEPVLLNVVGKDRIKQSIEVVTAEFKRTFIEHYQSQQDAIDKLKDIFEIYKLHEIAESIEIQYQKNWSKRIDRNLLADEESSFAVSMKEEEDAVDKKIAVMRTIKECVKRKNRVRMLLYILLKVEREFKKLVENAKTYACESKEDEEFFKKYLDEEYPLDWGLAHQRVKGPIIAWFNPALHLNTPDEMLSEKVSTLREEYAQMIAYSTKVNSPGTSSTDSEAVPTESSSIDSHVELSQNDVDMEEDISCAELQNLDMSASASTPEPLHDSFSFSPMSGPEYPELLGLDEIIPTSENESLDYNLLMTPSPEKIKLQEEFRSKETSPILKCGSLTVISHTSNTDNDPDIQISSSAAANPQGPPALSRVPSSRGPSQSSIFSNDVPPILTRHASPLEPTISSMGVGVAQPKPTKIKKIPSRPTVIKPKQKRLPKRETTAIPKKKTPSKRKSNSNFSIDSLLGPPSKKTDLGVKTSHDLAHFLSPLKEITTDFGQSEYSISLQVSPWHFGFLSPEISPQRGAPVTTGNLSHHAPQMPLMNSGLLMVKPFGNGNQPHPMPMPRFAPYQQPHPGFMIRPSGPQMQGFPQPHPNLPMLPPQMRGQSLQIRTPNPQMIQFYNHMMAKNQQARHAMNPNVGPNMILNFPNLGGLDNSQNFQSS